MDGAFDTVAVTWSQPEAAVKLYVAEPRRRSRAVIATCGHS